VVCKEFERTILDAWEEEQSQLAEKQMEVTPLKTVFLNNFNLFIYPFLKIWLICLEICYIQ